MKKVIKTYMTGLLVSCFIGIVLYHPILFGELSGTRVKNFPDYLAVITIELILISLFIVVLYLIGKAVIEFIEEK